MKLSIEFIKKRLRENPDMHVEGGVDVLNEPPKVNKLHAVSLNIDGYHFDSKLEAQRYQILKLWEQAGIIHNLCLEHKRLGEKDLIKAGKHRWLLQKKFTDKEGRNHRAITYTDDFQYEIDGVLIVEDVKGYVTQEFARTWKLFLSRYIDANFFVNKKRDGWYYSQEHK